MTEKRKKISIPSNDYKHLYGLSYGSIGAPYYETIENIKALLMDGVKVNEHISDGIVPLTLENFDKDNEPIEVAKVVLSVEHQQIEAKETTKVTAVVTPAEAINKTVTYRSEQTQFATIDPSTGVVTGVAEGTATIVGSTTNGIEGKIEVTVKPISVKNVNLSILKDTIQKEETTTVSAEVTPSDAASKEVTYESQQPGIATVDRSSGLVTGVAEGTATIVGSTANGVKGQIQVNVTKIPVTGLTVTLTQSTLNQAETTEVSATVQPSNADDAEVTYTSENDLVATVSGTTVTAVGEGTTNIVGRTSNGTEGKASITVNPAE